MYEGNEQLLKELSVVQHEFWRKWMYTVYSLSANTKEGNLIIPKEKRDKWFNRMRKKYDELDEKPKMRYQQQARKIASVYEKTGHSSISEDGTKITEMIPYKRFPEWMQEAFDTGQFFVTVVDRFEKMEEENQRLKEQIEETTKTYEISTDDYGVY